MLGAALLGLVGFALLTGSMLGIVLAACGLIVLELEFKGNFSVLGNGTWNLFNSFTFTAVPTFIFLGEILGQTGLAKRIYGAVSPLFERLPGRLLQTNIGACTVFSAISGSSTATAAVVGSIAYDELKGRGYRRSAIVGTIAAGGTLGILIPPSVAMIIYGAWQNVSIGALFMASIVPGLLLAGSFMVYIAITAYRRPGLAPAGGGRPHPGAGPGQVAGGLALRHPDLRHPGNDLLRPGDADRGGRAGLPDRHDPCRPLW